MLGDGHSNIFSRPFPLSKPITAILTGTLSGIPPGILFLIFAGILPGVRSENPAGILSGVVSSIFSQVFLRLFHWVGFCVAYRFLRRCVQQRDQFVIRSATQLLHDAHGLFDGWQPTRRPSPRAYLRTKQQHPGPALLLMSGPVCYANKPMLFNPSPDTT